MKRIQIKVLEEIWHIFTPACQLPMKAIAEVNLRSWSIALKKLVVSTSSEIIIPVLPLFQVHHTTRRVLFQTLQTKEHVLLQCQEVEVMISTFRRSPVFFMQHHGDGNPHIEDQG